MIVIGLIAILAAIALPSYSEYVVRTKLRSGTEGLSAYQGQLEQAFQDARSYRADGSEDCRIATFATEFFDLACASNSPTEYELTATSKADAGLGIAGDYVFTINQDGVRDTTAYKGVDPVVDDWVYKPHD